MTSRRLLSFVVLAVTLAACTGSTTDPSTGTTSSSPVPTDSPIPSGPIVFVEGEFFIDFADVLSELSWDGGTGELRVTNSSETPVEAPGLYAITPASTTVDAQITDAAPVGPGEEATFTVVFPDTLDPADAGLLVLSFGDESWGAMVPVVVE